MPVKPKRSGAANPRRGKLAAPQPPVPGFEQTPVA